MRDVLECIGKRALLGTTSPPVYRVRPIESAMAIDKCAIDASITRDEQAESLPPAPLACP